MWLYIFIYCIKFWSLITNNLLSNTLNTRDPVGSKNVYWIWPGHVHFIVCSGNTNLVRANLVWIHQTEIQYNMNEGFLGLGREVWLLGWKSVAAQWNTQYSRGTKFGKYQNKKTDRIVHCCPHIKLSVELGYTWVNAAFRGHYRFSVLHWACTG